MTKTLTLIALGALSLAALAVGPPPRKDTILDAVKDAEGLDEALRNLRAVLTLQPALKPEESRKRFKLLPGYEIDLIASEPGIRQPLHIAFDERGRMWVTEYRQYPFPAGLKVVSYDQYIRAKFDKVPPPPPNHIKGADRITILEDVKGDGSYSKATTFLDGLNIATASLPGKGGVWVLNPPYLLFYPKDKDDKPGKPTVHLSGFGLEDTHAVASSLTWGPDGWIYGAHGSTCTAKVRVEVSKDKKTTDFLGQAIWRYHPTRHVFELFAEGGGNTFGVAFDDEGRLFSGTNWGQYRGLHYVQGGYYVKGWGKHGPLTNPYALGYFEHMPHKGNADRLTHTFTVYGESLMPALRGKLIGVNALQRRVQVTKLIPDRSTFRTEEEPYLATTSDEWFRPVDIKPGPDGALYVADMYEPRINHVDPRDNWDRATGRIWRIRPTGWKAKAKEDFGKLTSKELVKRLESKDRWQRETARRLLGERKDESVREMMLKHIRAEDSVALEALLVLAHQGERGPIFHRAAYSSNPQVQRWGLRLIGDTPTLGAYRALGTPLYPLDSAEVRSQLASTARRVPELALPPLRRLWRLDKDADDPHIPLLTWWALESLMDSQREDIPGWFEDDELWKSRMVKRFILERMTQRWAMAGSKADLLACANLLGFAPDSSSANLLLLGLDKGLVGRTAAIPKELDQAIRKAWKRGATEARLTLGLRIGDADSVAKALKLAADDKADRPTRLQVIRTFGEIDEPKAVDVLLGVVKSSNAPSVRREALAALGRYKDAKIAPAVLALYPAQLPDDGTRAAAHALLASRPAWSLALLKAIDAKKLDARLVPTETVRAMQLHKDKELARLLAKHYGTVRASTPREKQREMVRIGKLLKSGTGDAKAGKLVFKATCAKCHKLFGEGGEVGPDLSGYERSNMMYWIENVVDPNAAIREEYMTFVVTTTDGRTLTGVVAGQDKTTVTLRDPENKTTAVPRNRIEEMRASPVSLMPEGQLAALKDQQVRDLFAYLMSRPPERKP